MEKVVLIFNSLLPEFIPASQVVRVTKLMKMEQKGFFQAKTTVFSTGSNTMIIEQKGFFKALFTFKR